MLIATAYDWKRTQGLCYSPPQSPASLVTSFFFLQGMPIDDLKEWLCSDIVDSAVTTQS